jgi:hypothetical protein
LRAIQVAVRNAIATQDTIASATTTDLGSKDAGSLTVSGTTTITGLGTVSAGIRKTVVFSGALLLTYNATSLILPGNANITTVAGDTAEFESLGSGNWRCNWYVRDDGTALVSAPFTDSTAIIKGSADATKLVRFEVDGLTTATTRVITVPDADITIARAGANNDITSLTACTALTNAAGIDIKGTNTNDSAAAGDVGEYVSSTVSAGSAVALTTNVTANVTSISLTAGDWVVTGNVAIFPAASTSLTVETGAVSITSAAIPADFTQQRHAAFVMGATSVMFPVPTVSIKLSGTATIYLIAAATFTVSTCGAYGSIRAWRVR